MLHSPASLPFLPEPSLSAAGGALFREPAILLQFDWVSADIRDGSNGRHRCVGTTQRHKHHREVEMASAAG